MKKDSLFYKASGAFRNFQPERNEKMSKRELEHLWEEEYFQLDDDGFDDWRSSEFWYGSEFWHGDQNYWDGVDIGCEYGDDYFGDEYSDDYVTEYDDDEHALQRIIDKIFNS